MIAVSESSGERLWSRNVTSTQMPYSAGDAVFVVDTDVLPQTLADLGLVDAGRLDPSYYDLLASEARLASFIAIAKNDVPVDHWFALRRPRGAGAHWETLLSWSGTMFEYLMPHLVMRSYPDTLLDESSRRVVRRQMEYATSRGAHAPSEFASGLRLRMQGIQRYQSEHRQTD